MSSSFLILLMISSDSPSLPILPPPFHACSQLFQLSFFIHFSILFLNSFFFHLSQQISCKPELFSHLLTGLSHKWKVPFSNNWLFFTIFFIYIYIVNTIYSTYYFNFQVISLFYVSILQNVM